MGQELSHHRTATKTSRSAAAILDVQRRQWSAGYRTPVESYLRKDPELATDRETLLDLIYNEVLLREQGDGEVKLSEYLERFPEYVADLQPLFAVHRALEPKSPAVSEVDRSDTAAAETIGGHQILEELGRGGMGIVYKARQPGTGRVVALKVILAGRFASEQEIARFQAEAVAAARLDHPGIVPVYQAGRDGETYFFSMGFVAGKSLATQLAEDGAPTVQRSAELIRDAALAVQFAHQHGVVHRDLKPQNLMLADVAEHDTRDEHTPQAERPTPSLVDSLARPQPSDGTFNGPDRWQVRITDFGLAQQECQNSGMTTTGHVLGTPQYMSPEQAQARHDRIGPASDIYSLGAVLYECLTGRPPFDAVTTFDVLASVIYSDPTPPRLLNPKLDRDIETICLKCLEKDPVRRYASAALLVADLVRFLSGQAILARPVGPLGRSWRWCRRRPASAAMLAMIALLVGTLLAASFSFAVIVRGQNIAIQDSLIRTERAEQATRKQLYDALVADANGKRSSGQAGQRVKSLESLAKAAALAHELRLPQHDLLRLRREVIAAMMLPDVEVDEIPQVELLGGDHGVCFDRAGEQLLGCDDSGRLVVCDLVRGHQTVLEMPPAELCEQAQFLSGTRRVAALRWRETDGIEQASVYLWDLDALPSHPLELAVARPRAFDVAPDGKSLAVVSQNGMISICDAKTGTVRRTVVTGPASGLRFHPDGRRLALWQGSDVRLIDDDDGTEIARFRRPSEAVIQDVAFSDDGHLMATGTSDYNAYIWHLDRDQQPLHVLQGHQGWINHVAFHPSGRFLVTACRRDGMSRLWNVRNGKEIVRFEGRAVAFSLDQQNIMGMFGKMVRRWRIHCADEYRPLRDSSVDAVCGDGEFFPDGRFLTTFGWDRVHLWDLTSDRLVDELCTEQMSIGGVSPDGESYIATCADFDARLGKLLRFRLQWHDSVPQLTPARSIPIVASFLPAEAADCGGLDSISLNRDGTRVAVAGGGLAWVQSVDDATGPSTVVRHASADCVTISPDGKWLATAARSGWGIKVWNAITGAQVADLAADQAGTITGFSPDGEWLMGCTSSELLAWPLEQWAQPPRRLALGQRTVNWPRLAFSSDGRYLALSHRHYEIALVDPQIGSLLTIVPAQHHNPWMAFCPGGDQFAFGDRDQGASILRWQSVRAKLAEMRLDW